MISINHYYLSLKNLYFNTSKLEKLKTINCIYFTKVKYYFKVNYKTYKLSRGYYNNFENVSSV